VSTKTYHLGILGGGNISDTHARAAASLPNVRVAAVCGVNETRVRAMAERHGAAAYVDVDAFLRHRPLDIVAIGSPSGLHGAQVAAAAAQGLHLLVEKPLEVTTARIDEMARTVEQAGVTLGVFFQDRSTPDFVALKHDLEAGALGRVTLADARVKWYRPPEYYSQSRWRGTWALDGGGALMNQGIHTADLLLWLLGDVRRVYAKAVTALHAIEVEDTVVAVLEFASGAVGTLECTTAAWPGYNRRVALSGSAGTVVIEQDRVVQRDLREVEGQAADGGESGRSAAGAKAEGTKAGASAASPVVADASAHRRVIEDFVEALDSGRTPRVSLREGRRSVALAEAIYQSSRSGQAVDL
jgi:UDP-N-acetyl-2-amino-2-deoxyglucuronate dehydrogenase